MSSLYGDGEPAGKWQNVPNITVISEWKRAGEMAREAARQMQQLALCAGSLTDNEIQEAFKIMDGIEQAFRHLIADEEGTASWTR
jgi:hypothetical protein